MFGIKYNKLKSGRFGDVSITKARLNILPVPEPVPEPEAVLALYAYFRNASTSEAIVGKTIDGSTWSYVNTGTTIMTTDSTWGKFYITGKPDGSTLIVTGGIANGMMVSKDNGLTWTAVPLSGLDTTILAPALWTGTRWLFGRGTIYAMDDNQENIISVLPSTGGNTFNLQQNPITKTILVFGGQGGGNYIWRSTDDGTTWTRPGFGIMADYMRGGVYSPELNRWVAFGTWGTSYSDDDGLTWSPRSSMDGFQIENVTWIPDDGLFVLSHANPGGIKTSSDGINWSGNIVPAGTTAFWNVQKVFSKYFGRVFVSGAATFMEAPDLMGPWTAINTGFPLQRSQGFFLTSS